MTGKIWVALPMDALPLPNAVALRLSIKTIIHQKIPMPYRYNQRQAVICILVW